ncbi:MAG: transposase [Candidatus Competibacteraceae bacterium]
MTETCRHHDSDLTDAQWGLIEPLLPAPKKQPGGHPGTHRRDRRQGDHGILYVTRTGLPVGWYRPTMGTGTRSLIASILLASTGRLGAGHWRRLCAAKNETPPRAGLKNLGRQCRQPKCQGLRQPGAKGFDGGKQVRRNGICWLIRSTDHRPVVTAANVSVIAGVATPLTHYLPTASSGFAISGSMAAIPAKDP